MGLFSQRKVKHIPNNEKREFLLSQVIGRMAEYGAVDPSTGTRNTYTKSALEEEFSFLPDHILFGFPEASILIMFESYWYWKINKNLSGFDNFFNIDKERKSLGFPAGIPVGDISREDFIILRCRLEEPEKWTLDNISDEELRFSLKNISDYCERYYRELYS